MLHPRENLQLRGHEKEKNSFLTAFHSSRFSPAWLLRGAFGIGKATFAYHLARYILSGRQDKNTEFSGDESLCRRMIAQSHGDLWTLKEQEENQEIGVDVIRSLNGFLNHTTAEGGWRVIILETCDRMNRNAANALLKRLEEPPPKTVFFLTTSVPGRLLPTLRSRCQMMSFSPLSEEVVLDILKSQGYAPLKTCPFGKGSPGHMIRLIEGEGAQIYKDFHDVLDGKKDVSPFVKAYGAEEKSFAFTEDLLRAFLHNQLLEKGMGKASFFQEISLDDALKIYEKVDDLLNQCHLAQLDRKATLVCALMVLKGKK